MWSRYLLIKTEIRQEKVKGTRFFHSPNITKVISNTQIMMINIPAPITTPNLPTPYHPTNPYK